MVGGAGVVETEAAFLLLLFLGNAVVAGEAAAGLAFC